MDVQVTSCSFWKYSHEFVVFSSADDHYVTVPEGLRINDVTAADEGEYKCRAEEWTTGTVDSATITVIVDPTEDTVAVGKYSEVLFNDKCSLFKIYFFSIHLCCYINGVNSIVVVV